MNRTTRSGPVRLEHRPTADEAMNALPGILRSQLAALFGAPPHAAEVAVSLLPYGHRALLEGYGLTHTTTPTVEGPAAVEQVEEPRQRVELTSLGWAVIEACTKRDHPIPDDAELERRAQAVREQLVGEVQQARGVGRRVPMPLYMATFGYKPEVWAGLIRSRENREEIVRKVLEEAGCKLRGIWYAFGEADGFILIEAPDHKTAAGIAIAIASSGAFRRFEMTVLMTQSELLEALETASDIHYAATAEPVHAY